MNASALAAELRKRGITVTKVAEGTDTEDGEITITPEVGVQVPSGMYDDGTYNVVRSFSNGENFDFYHPTDDLTMLVRNINDAIAAAAGKPEHDEDAPAPTTESQELNDGDRVTLSFPDRPDHRNTGIVREAAHAMLVIEVDDDPGEEYEYRRRGDHWFEVNDSSVPVRIERTATAEATPATIVNQLIEGVTAPTFPPRRDDGTYEVETKEPVTLPDGTYEAVQHGYVIELGGKEFPTARGTRQTREVALQNPKQAQVREGKVFVVLEAASKSVELDITWPDGVYEIEAVVRKTELWARRYGCAAKLVEETGPGGGNPTFKVSGPEDKLRKLLLNYTGGDAEEAAELLGESKRKVTGTDVHTPPALGTKRVTKKGRKVDAFFARKGKAAYRGARKKVRESEDTQIKTGSPEHRATLLANRAKLQASIDGLTADRQPAWKVDFNRRQLEKLDATIKKFGFSESEHDPVSFHITGDHPTREIPIEDAAEHGRAFQVAFDRGFEPLLVNVYSDTCEEQDAEDAAFEFLAKHHPEALKHSHATEREEVTVRLLRDDERPRRSWYGTGQIRARDESALREDVDDDLGIEDPEEDEAQALADARGEIENGECAVIQSPASGPDTVWFSGKSLGAIESIEDALRLVAAESERQQFYPNLFHVNERGNVMQLDPTTGKEIRSWV